MRSNPDRNAVSVQRTARAEGPETMTVLDADSRRTWAREVAVGLAAMLPAERQFILCSYADGLTNSTIATNSGLSETSVTQAIASGMRKLSASLEKSYRPDKPAAPRTAPTISRWGRHRAGTHPITRPHAASF